MINFFMLTENLNQVCIRDLSIYFSYKMPIAYRVKKDLRIRRGLHNEKHLDAITAGHYFVITDAEAFDFNLRHIFRSTIYNLAEDYTKERFKIPQEKKNKPIYIGELNASEFSNIG